MRKAIEAEITAAETELQGMDEDMAALGEMWKGTAKDAFMEQYRKDSEYLAGMLGNMKSIKESLVFARDTYDAGEDSVEELVNGLSV